jgi:hypothetical protein
MSDHLIVAVVAVISGGFAIPVGFLLDLPPLETYLAAVVGALAGMAFFVFVGSGLRDWIVKKASAVYTVGLALIIEIAGI